MRQVPKKKNIFRALFTITLFDHISLTIGFPVLTFLCFDKQSTLFAVTTSYATRSFWYGMCNALPHFIAIIAGPLLSFVSDHWGRKRLLLIGALGALLLCSFTALSIFFGILWLLILGCILGGLCSRTEPIAVAVVGDISAPSRKIVNMGYLQFSIAVGAFLGPLLGGFLAQRFFFPTLNFLLPYLVGISTALATTVITLFYFQESLQPKMRTKTSVLLSLKQLLNKEVARISIILILTQISWRIYYQFMPPLLKIQLHYNATLIGMFVALVALWLCVATFIIIRILNHFFTTAKIIRYASWALFLGLLVAILGAELNSSLLIWCSAIPVAMGDVIIFSALVTLYSDEVSVSDQGKVMGLCFIIVSAVWAFTGLLGGYLIAININLPILCAPITMICLFYFLSRRKI